MRLGQVLDRLEQANIRLKLSKCMFCANTVEYLGHVVSDKGVLPNPKKVERLQGMAPPVNVSEVRSFLGLAGYYRRFVRNFAETTSPITQLLKADHKFEWTVQCQVAFDSIKTLLTTAPVLAYPNFTKSFVLDPDGCDYSVGAVLSQYDDLGIEHSVAYFSRTLLPREEKVPHNTKRMSGNGGRNEAFPTLLVGTHIHRPD